MLAELDLDSHVDTSGNNQDDLLTLYLGSQSAEHLNAKHFDARNEKINRSL